MERAGVVNTLSLAAGEVAELGVAAESAKENGQLWQLTDCDLFKKKKKKLTDCDRLRPSAASWLSASGLLIPY